MPSTDTERFIDAAGIRTCYFEQGQGRPLLLLHGSGVGVSGYANWNKTVPELGKFCRAIAMDIAGFGYSEPPADASYDMGYWVKHVYDFVQALNIEKIDLLGNSFGGAVALAFTIAHPERVGRVMLMGATGVRFDMPPWMGAGQQGELTTSNLKAVLERFTIDPANITDEMVESRLAAANRSVQKARQSKLFPTRESRVTALLSPPEAIAAIEKHFLIVHGKDDRIVPLDTSLTMHKLIARSDLHLFANCGHWSHIDRASDFNALARQFFNSRSN